MLAEKLMGDLKVAMKARDKTRLSVIRQIRAQIQNTEIAKRQALDDSDILGVISKEAKQRRESIGEFKKADRQDLVAQEEAELAILLEYLPQQMSREEIVTVARRMIDEIEARGPGDKGKVMPRLVAELKGKVEGREISEVVTELLGG